MDLATIIGALSDPSAYPHAVDELEVHQTHISVVFLAGPYAYKIKKPLSLGFLDYSTLERRKRFCDEETTVNRRLAPDVYLGVVPVSQNGDAVRIGGSGTVIEWAVKMRRLPAEATLSAHLDRGEAGPEQLAMIARRIADFHAQAGAGPTIAEAARFDAVAANALENFAQSSALFGRTVSVSVFERALERTKRALDALRPLIEARAARGIPRDGHGDLRLDHVYLFPDRAPPADLAIVDAIEFNPRYRHADPIADMAFLDMDLQIHGRRDLAREFSGTYLQAANDAEGAQLLPFYRSYRAAVRAKIEGITSMEAEVPAPARTAAIQRARAHWLLALAALDAPGHCPCVVLVGGLPGTGKSTLARELAERTGFNLIRTDVIRKELAEQRGVTPSSAGFEQGIYTPEWTERTYAACLQRAEALLFQGRRVLIDASFGRDSHRTLFLDAAIRWGVPGVLLVCATDPAVALDRIKHRHGDASDADALIYEQAARHWEPLGPAMQQRAHSIPTDGTPASALAAARSALRGAGCDCDS